MNKKDNFKENECILFSEKKLKYASQHYNTDKINTIIKKINIVDSLSDGKENLGLTMSTLLEKVKILNTELSIKKLESQLHKYFLEIEEKVSYAENIFKFINVYIQSIKNIINEILNLLYNLDPNLIFENEYVKITKTVNKCVQEIDNIVEKAYYSDVHLLFLTGVDINDTFVINIFESDNEKLNELIEKHVEDGLSFTFSMPCVDTISLELYCYTLGPEYSYKKTEFVPYENITNMEKYIKKHIEKFNQAYKKIIDEEKILVSFKEILNLKKEIFIANKPIILSEYFKNN